MNPTFCWAINRYTTIHTTKQNYLTTWTLRFQVPFPTAHERVIAEHRSWICWSAGASSPSTLPTRWSDTYRCPCRSLLPPIRKCHRELSVPVKFEYMTCISTNYRRFSRVSPKIFFKKIFGFAPNGIFASICRSKSASHKAKWALSVLRQLQFLLS